MPNLPPSTRRCTTATGAHGFDTDHWTLAQITTVIQRLTGVAYHRGHVRKLLSHAGTIAPSAPPPGGRARSAGHRPLGGRGLAVGSAATPAVVGPRSCSGTSRAPRCCRSSGAPGRHRVTPRSSATDSTGSGHPWPPPCATAPAAVARPRLPPPGQRRRHPDPDRRPGRAAPLLGGQKATRVWDGLPAHRSKARGAWLRRQRSWLVVEPLPGDAPDLNPVEALRSSLKGVELANLAGDTSTTSSLRPSAASSGSATPTTWPTHSCVTAACPCGDHVTGRSEALL